MLEHNRRHEDPGNYGEEPVGSETHSFLVRNSGWKLRNGRNGNRKRGGDMLLQSTSHSPSKNQRRRLIEITAIADNDTLVEDASPPPPPLLSEANRLKLLWKREHRRSRPSHIQVTVL
ncbi:unnamed protein product [Arctogadus glacialis]